MTINATQLVCVNSTCPHPGGADPRGPEQVGTGVCMDVEDLRRPLGGCPWEPHSARTQTQLWVGAARDWLSRAASARMPPLGATAQMPSHAPLLSSPLLRCPPGCPGSAAPGRMTPSDAPARQPLLRCPPPCLCSAAPARQPPARMTPSDAPCPRQHPDPARMPRHQNQAEKPKETRFQTIDGKTN